MKKQYLIICMVGLALIASGLAKASIPVIWQADPNGSYLDTNITGNGITRVKLTPDNNYVMVFHYNGGAYGIPTRVDKLDASTGNFVWPDNQDYPGNEDYFKEVQKPGERLSLNGWVDCNGNLYIMGSWSGYTIWKYDPNLVTELCSYTGGGGFEYVYNAIDDCEYLYVAGMTGSGSNQGSAIVKLDLDNCNVIWGPVVSKNTSDKDGYCFGIALDSEKNVFRVGTDSSFGASDHGRLIGHDATDGSEILNYTVDELNSRIAGITIDSDDYMYIAYCYDYTPTGQERTVVQKLDPNSGTADVICEYRFDDIGMYLSLDNAIVKHTENSFYVAFNQRQDGTTVPGIAEFDLNCNLLWKDTIDRPGWNLGRGIDAYEDYIYVGLTNDADASQTQVLCLAPEPPCGAVVYFNDFEDTGDPLNEWSNTSTATTPGTAEHHADRFLGQFSNETVSLTLNNLPLHTEIIVSLDLYIIQSWDGDHGYYGPDEWELTIQGDSTSLLHTTFSNIIDHTQTYPDTYPGGGSYPRWTGSDEINTLGYPIWGDSVYRLSFTFSHTPGSIQLDFDGSPNQAISDESWGIDNVRIEICEPPCGVDIDIKPQSCPNPLNVKSKGNICVAILGSEEFDANAIDPASVRLQGVAPIRSKLEDVATPVPDGPIAYWTFDDPCDPGHDDSGNGHDGTVISAQSADGICGKALSFDGQNDYVEVPDHDELDPSTQEITIAAWVNISTYDALTSSLYYGIVGKTASPTRPIGSYMFGIVNNNDLTYEGKLIFQVCYDGLHFQDIFSDSQVPLGTPENPWVHVAVTHDTSQNSKFFINGLLDAVDSSSITTDFANNDLPLRIGHTNSFWDYFRGSMDEVRIYDRALEASEIEELAAACDADECKCTVEGPDGYTDLTIKFKTQQLVAAIGDVNNGDVLQLDLTGLLDDGTAIQGTDCMVVVGNFKAFKKGDINKDGITNIVDFTLMAQTWLQSTLPED